MFDFKVFFCEPHHFFNNSKNDYFANTDNIRDLNFTIFSGGPRYPASRSHKIRLHETPLLKLVCPVMPPDKGSLAHASSS